MPALPLGPHPPALSEMLCPPFVIFLFSSPLGDTDGPLRACRLHVLARCRRASWSWKDSTTFAFASHLAPSVFLFLFTSTHSFFPSAP